MFRPIKKIFTYIQKNASNGTMFGSTTSVNSNASNNGSRLERELQAQAAEQQQQQPEKVEQNSVQEQQHQLEDDDIERQIKTSIIDASKVHTSKSKVMLPLQLQLDDELADFAHEPVTLGVADEDDDELEEQFLELDNFPNNEIIVLSDGELNSSLASDNISEDPLAIDDFTQPLARGGDEEENDVVDVEVENNGDLLWLKLDTPVTEAGEVVIASPTTDTKPVAPKTKGEEELRSDGGSDSGLGSENDRHNNSITTTATTATTTTGAASSVTSTASTTTLPLRSNLKRRLEDDAMELALVPEIVSGSAAGSANICSTQKRPKRSINFDSVKVYYFPRQQGFSCVPTAGGCTLGMGARHIAFKTMTLTEHAAELRRAHRSQNQDQQQQNLQVRGSSSDDSEESEEDYLSEGSGSDADDGSNGFLQPVTPKQRRALLKAAGVRKIDASEKIDCRDIRNSREVCGCSCREFCDPETCACSQAGIKCQVDRAMFPCGCTREACGNTVGRVEFNPTRVRTHYIHTVMRLDMEQRQSQGPSIGSSGNNSSLIYGSSSGSSTVVAGVESSTVVATASAASHCYFMQPQSNYSSGYASPAYTPETSVSYYQQQQPQQTTPQATGSSTSASANGGACSNSDASGSSSSGSQQPSYAASYPQLDSLDSGLFASGSNVTPSYGELLTPTYHPALSYGSAQLNSYTTYQQTSPASAGGGSSIGSHGAYSSCAVPSAPPYGNATTTASNATQYQHANALETTAASMNVRSSSSSSSISITASSCSTGLARLSGGRRTGDFISLNAPIGSSSRLSQINDLLQHNRNTTAALVAVSEGYAASAVLNRSSGMVGVGNGSNCRTSTTNTTTNTTTTTIDSIDTPPIVEEAQRSNCMTFEELPPPIINPAPIVAVVEQQLERKHLIVSTAPQPRQPIDASVGLTDMLPNGSSSTSSGI